MVHIYIGDVDILTPCDRMEDCEALYGILCPGEVHGMCCFGGSNLIRYREYFVHIPASINEVKNIDIEFYKSRFRISE